MEACVYIPKHVVDESLAAPHEPGKRLLEPLKALSLAHNLPVHILEDMQVANDAEVHRHEADLWICLDGEAEFVVGGAMHEPWAKTLPDGGVDDREIKAKEITGGTSYTVRAGDIVWIPAGQPHLHRTETSARFYIIKIPTSPPVPLAEVPGWAG